MIISLQIWVPKFAVTDCFLSDLCIVRVLGWVREAECIGAQTRHCVFYYTRGQGCQSGPSGTLSHYASHCLGLPTQRQVLLLLIRITCICSESCFCWNLKSQRLAARVWTDLVEICWTKLVNAEKGHPSARCNRLPEYDAVYGMFFFNPPPKYNPHRGTHFLTISFRKGILAESSKV